MASQYSEKSELPAEAVEAASKNCPEWNLTVITNIPTPYRCAFFNLLTDVALAQRCGVHVLYCAKTEPGRHWDSDSFDMRHHHSFVHGLHLQMFGVTFHLNPAIGRLIPRGRTVLLCAGSWNMPSLWLAMITAWTQQVVKVFWSEGHSDAQRHRSGPIAWARRFVLRRFDAFAVPNLRSKNWVQQHLRDEGTFVDLPNTVNERFYQRTSETERLAARRKLGIRDGVRLFLQVSQLESRKGVVELATAFLRVASTTAVDCQLSIVGTGSLADSLLQTVEQAKGHGSVVLPGHLHGDGVRLWLMAADVFVLNTFRDPNPLGPIEASFAALPLLLSTRAGNHDELINDDTGFSIRNASDPSTELDQMLRTPLAQLRDMGRCAQENARERFSADAVAKRLLSQLRVLV